MYESDIARLEGLFEDLTVQINSSKTEESKQELNGKRSSIFDEIRRLRRLQWEEETDTVHYDDER